MTTRAKSILFQFLYPIAMIGFLLWAHYGDFDFFIGSLILFVMALLHIFCFFRVISGSKNDEDSVDATIFSCTMLSVIGHNIFSYMRNNARTEISDLGVLCFIMFLICGLSWGYLSIRKENRLLGINKVTLDDMNIPLIFLFMVWIIVVSYVLNFGTFYILVPLFWGIILILLMMEPEEPSIVVKVLLLLLLLPSLCYQAYQYIF